MSIARDFSLDAKYRLEEGAVFLSGIQALVRLPLDQHRADRRRGLNTAHADLRLPRLAAGRARPAPSSATSRAAAPSTTSSSSPASTRTSARPSSTAASSRTSSRSRSTTACSACGTARRPGVDRSGDVFKHANFAGVGQERRRAGAGRRRSARRSPRRCRPHSEVALYDALMPMLFPGNVQEILDLGRLGFELSRYSGLWVGVQDRHQRRRRVRHRRGRPGRVAVVDPAFELRRPPVAARRRTRTCSRPSACDDGARDPLRRAWRRPGCFAAANRLNRDHAADARAPGSASSPPARPTTTCARRWPSSGSTTRRCAATASGILKIGMLFPMEPRIVREFARGLEEILVVEEKRVVPRAVLRDVLYDAGRAPARRRQARRGGPAAAAGRRRARRRPDRAVRRQRASSAAAIASVEARESGALDALQRASRARCTLARASRTSARAARTTARPCVPEGAWPPPGIGCHGMALGMDRGASSGVTHMGGEGAQWVGVAPFTRARRTSSRTSATARSSTRAALAISQAVAAGANITYKILYNSRGGDDRRAGRGRRAAVPALTRRARGRGRQADHRHHRRARQVPGATRAGRRASRSGIATGSTRRSGPARRSPASPC